MTTTEPPAEHLVCGSDGEHWLQHRHGTTGRANAFYRNQVIDYLNGAMCSFIARQEMVFVATADGGGRADCSFRAGPPGFIRVLDERTLAYPEYRGNGVMASLGNLTENHCIGMLFVDFTVGKIGLHVNGSARIVENDEVARSPRAVDVLLGDLSETGGRRPERWVLVSVDEAYIHCSKHIPRMQPVAAEVAWGTDDERAKGGDYFGVRASRVDSSRPSTTTDSQPIRDGQTIDTERLTRPPGW